MNKKRPRRNSRPAGHTETLPEEVLEHIEADPGFRRMMEESDRAEGEGRWTPHEEVVKRFQSARNKRR